MGCGSQQLGRRWELRHVLPMSSSAAVGAASSTLCLFIYLFLSPECETFCMGDQGTSECLLCSEAELGQGAHSSAWRQTRGEHSTSDAELRYGAEREQHLQEDNCFTEIKLLQKTQLYIDIQPLPCCGLCVYVPISTQSQTERKLCIYIEISARFCLFAVGAAGER